MDNQSFSTFIIDNHRVTVRDFGDKELILEVINPQLTRKYKTGNIVLNNINLNALKTGLNKSNPSIRIEFTQAENSIQLKAIIQIPLLPLIVEIITCNLQKQLNENNQNNVLLSQIADAFTKTKQIIGNIKQKQNNTKNNLISFIQKQKQPYDQEGNYLDDVQNYDGISQFGSLNFTNKGKGVGELFFCYGDIQNPIQIFCNSIDSTVSGQRQQYNYYFYCYSFRDIVTIHDTSRPFKVMVFDGGYGSQFRNIILNATEIKQK